MKYIDDEEKVIILKSDYSGQTLVKVDNRTWVYVKEGQDVKEIKRKYLAKFGPKPTHKLCGDCGEEKDRKEFYSNTDAADGKDYYCKKCRREKNRKVA